MALELFPDCTVSVVLISGNPIKMRPLAEGLDSGHMTIISLSRSYSQRWILY